MSRRHQWAVFVAYGLTDAEARATEAGAEQRLDSEHRLSVDGPGCVNCEQAWSQKVAAAPCPAPWYDLRTRETASVRQA